MNKEIKSPSCKHPIIHKKIMSEGHYCYIVCLKCEKYWKAEQVDSRDE